MKGDVACVADTSSISNIVPFMLLILIDNNNQTLEKKEKQTIRSAANR